jgi:aminopeptidase C
MTANKILTVNRILEAKCRRLDAIYREIVALGFTGEDSLVEALRAEREAILREMYAIRRMCMGMPEVTP